MKKIKQDIYTKTFYIFLAALSILFIVSFALGKYLITTIITSNNLDATVIMNDFYTTWSILFVIVLFILFFITKLLNGISDKVENELSELQIYMKKLSKDKKYDAIYNPQNYIEFLHISTVMKNLVKRLHSKDKKK